MAAVFLAQKGHGTHVSSAAAGLPFVPDLPIYADQINFASTYQVSAMRRKQWPIGHLSFLFNSIPLVHSRKSAGACSL